jgi:hypothetical protein
VQYPDILAYQSLLHNLAVEFSPRISQILGSPVVDFFVMIANQALSFVHQMREKPDFTPPILDSLVCESQAQRPRNWKNEAIHYSFHVFVSNPISAAIPAKLSQLVSLSESREVSDDAEMQAFLLLTVLWVAISEFSQVVNHMRSGPSGLDLRVMESLFLCGLLGGGASMVSSQAFRVLDSIINGVPTDAPSIAENEEVQVMIHKFADCFRFSEQLTPQMVAAFPLFWNHRYRDLTSGGSPEVVIELPDGPFRREGQSGLTPLEFYGDFLFDEPTVSDGFCNRILNVLTKIANRGNQLRNREDPETKRLVRDDVKRYQHTVIEADLPFFDFLQAKRVNGEAAISRILECFPLEIKEITERSLPPRALLNGFILEFAKLWGKTDLFALENGDRLPAPDQPPALGELWAEGSEGIRAMLDGDVT